MGLPLLCLIHLQAHITQPLMTTCTYFLPGCCSQEYLGLSDSFGVCSPPTLLRVCQWFSWRAERGCMCKTNVDISLFKYHTSEGGHGSQGHQKGFPHELLFPFKSTRDPAVSAGPHTRLSALLCELADCCWCHLANTDVQVFFFHHGPHLSLVQRSATK